MNLVQQQQYQLYRDGYCVIPVFDKMEMQKISDTFQNICMNALELRPISEVNEPRFRFVLGGVGYVPFASVFYHPFTRGIYQRAYETAKNFEIFKDYIKARFKEEEVSDPERIRCCMLPDRCLFRFPDQVVDETGKWHRDIAPNLEDESVDICFGGWINLNNDIDQFFKCYKGSHQKDHPINEMLLNKDGNINKSSTGFSNFSSKEDQKFLKDNWNTQGGGLITIPPGHMVIFRENIIHVVMKNPPSTVPIMRIHTAFLVTTNRIPLHDRAVDNKHSKGKIAKSLSLIEFFNRQELVPVRSGQGTPTYSPFNAMGNQRRTLMRLSNHYIDECRTRKNGQLDIVKKFLGSLEELNMKYSPMTPEELSIYFP